MTINKSQNIQAMFTRIAPRYDLLNRTLSVRIDQLWRKKAVQYLAQKSELQILDLCAGTLDLTLAVLKQHADAQVTALDFSEAMLKAGEPKIPSPLKKQVKLVVGDGMNLELPANSFDGVLCGFGMRNIVDNAKAMSEIRQVLRTGGRFITLEFFKPTSLSAKLFYATYGKWILPRIGSWLSKDPEAYQYLFDSIQSYTSAQEYEALLQKSGFRLVANKALSGAVANIVVGEKI